MYCQTKFKFEKAKNNIKHTHTHTNNQYLFTYSRGHCVHSRTASCAVTNDIILVLSLYLFTHQLMKNALCIVIDKHSIFGTDRWSA